MMITRKKDLHISQPSWLYHTQYYYNQLGNRCV